VPALIIVRVSLRQAIEPSTVASRKPGVGVLPLRSGDSNTLGLGELGTARKDESWSYSSGSPRKPTQVHIGMESWGTKSGGNV
jgi:hypothetical protein